MLKLFKKYFIILLMRLISKGLQFLVPSILEIILFIYETECNPFYFNIYLEIYNKRNELYLLVLLSIFCYLINLGYISLLLQFIGIYRYSKTIYKWKHHIKKIENFNLNKNVFIFNDD